MVREEVVDIIRELVDFHMDKLKENYKSFEEAVAKCDLYESLISFSHITYHTERVKVAASQLQEFRGVEGERIWKEAYGINQDATDIAIVVSRNCECKKR